MHSERIYVALDLETTGLDANKDAIIEIGAVRFQNGVVLERFESLINPLRAIPPRIQQITGIRDADVADAPLFAQVIPELLAFVGPDVSGLVAHNAAFDMGFLRTHGVNFHRPAFDTLELAAMLLPRQASYSLGELSHHLNITLEEAHRALDDAEATAHLFMALLTRIDDVPLPVIQTILASAGETDWPPLLLLQEHAPLAERSDPVILAPRLELERAPALLADDSAIAAIALDEVDAIFTPEGALGVVMGAGYEQRVGQAEMAHRIADAFNLGNHLMVEAGTGTGKSLAYLAPAALWAQANERRVVVATNTIALQDQLIEKDLPQVQAILATSGKLPVRTALLKGRSNYLCLRRLNLWRSSHTLKPAELSILARVLVWLPTTQTGDVAELALPTPADREVWQQICSDSATCSEDRCGAHVHARARDFYYVAHRRAEAAHLVIVNHALLFADIAAEGRVLPPWAHLVLDEAHHLEEAATDQLTYSVEFGRVQNLLKRILPEGDIFAALLAAATRLASSAAPRQMTALGTRAKATAEALRAFHTVLLHFATQQRDARSEGGWVQRVMIDGAARSQPMWSEIEIEWEHTSESLGKVVQASAEMLALVASERWDEHEPYATIISDLAGVHAHLEELLAQMERMIYVPSHATREAGNDALVCWLELGEQRNQVALFSAPLHIGHLIQSELIHKRRSVILTGATLRTGSNFRFIRERLGLWDVPTAIVDSPFDFKRAALLYMPSDLAQPNSPSYQPAIERAIIDAAEACHGRTLVLFTSNTHLRTTGEAVRGALERAGIAVLQQGTTSRHRLLRDFRAADQAVLLGTRTYWEGIDLPGDELRCLLIAKLPFAVPNDPLVAARSAECDNSFADYMLPDAVLRFRQGFGRLIRRTTDRGVVVLLDSRVWRKEYGQVFLDALPPCTERNAPLSILSNEIEQWLAR